MIDEPSAIDIPSTSAVDKYIISPMISNGLTLVCTYTENPAKKI